MPRRSSRGGFTAGGAWAIRFPAPDKIKFFAVVKGHCWVSVDGEAKPIYFEAGDVGLLAAQRSFVLASDPGVVPIDAMDVFFRRRQDDGATG
ncbi:cupin domain-containing protein [Ancylobacter dichloromethanicus]